MLLLTHSIYYLLCSSLILLGLNTEKKRKKSNQDLRERYSSFFFFFLKMVLFSSRCAMKRDVIIVMIFTILVLIILSRSSSIQAGRFITTKRRHNLSVARVQDYKNHHAFVITEMSTFKKFRGRSSKVRRKIDGNEDEEEKRIIPAGPNPLHNR
ncbi:PREDICTED: CLAVATA3/ESR (CLE)-related protein 21 [Brassica oleracea var. oleracea]|nr:PREDICTED: CLAVATA3/ESR (CLE)-related protein 21 [Brassica oleracea var. oleracea]